GIEVGLGRWKDFSDEPFVSLGIDEIQVEIDAASAAFDARAPWKTLPSLRRGLIRLRGLRADVAGSGLPPNEKLELEHRLAPREREFEEAIALAHGIDFLPTSSRGEVTRGSRFRIEVQVTNGSPEPVEVRAIRVLTGPGSLVQEFEDDETRFPDLPERLSGTRKLEARFDVTMGPAAPYDRPYWVRTDPSIDRFTLLEPELFGRPSRPPGLVSALSLQSGEVEITLAKPVQYRYPGRWVGGEKQKRVSVLPRVSVEISPDVVVFPVASDDRTRPISVTARYEGTEPALGSLRLEVPAGFVVEPQSVPLTFSRENEASTVRFQLTPGAAVERGSYLVHAVAEIGGEEFRESVDSIEYHHIETRYLFEPAQAKVEALDLQMAPVRVGYIEGVGDDVPMAIRQLGAELSFLGEADLAEGDLSKYDVIVTGVRAYLNRQDLRAYNRRLLDYVSEGGTLLVQYNKMEFNEAPWGPYPKNVSNNRVTVEEAPIQILVPDHPVFHHPNRITAADWGGWVQERGLYFLEEKGDPRYQELL
ncbi:MAG TPA: hypothetical protein VIG29_16830, partial [Vicinamibacteria bacterium]